MDIINVNKKEVRQKEAKRMEDDRTRNRRIELKCLRKNKDSGEKKIPNMCS